MSLRIIFMGTPEFAVASLDILVKNNYNIVGVITAPDKPAGRGQQLQESAVKKYAVHHQLNILQPEKLKATEFLDELRALNADLQIVVAFRMLPEVVWNMPRLGTFNLHASLLPQYRGAAPINWAVINGEKETGVTTFFLKQEIDTGEMVFNQRVPIHENETAGELHDELMHTGAQLVLRTVQAIENGSSPRTTQLTDGITLKHAPKLFKENGKVNWNQPVEKVHNLIRGLSPYPTAWTELQATNGTITSLKIFKTTKEPVLHAHLPGQVISDEKKVFKIAVPDGYIVIHELQLAGKKRMETEEFLRGFPLRENWKALS